VMIARASPRLCRIYGAGTASSSGGSIGSAAEMIALLSLVEELRQRDCDFRILSGPCPIDTTTASGRLLFHGAATDVRRHPVADRPAAGTARSGLTSAGPNSRGREGRSVPRHRQSGTFQCWKPVNRPFRSPVACGEGELLLSKPVRSAILPAKPPESGECRLE
jgi:hypothetical protein